MADLQQQFYPTREQFLLDMDCTNPEYIGGGTYGRVFRMKCKLTDGNLEADKLYAVKYIEATNEQIFYKIQNEFIINKMIERHPNIIAVEKVYAWQEYLPKKYVLVLVMELASRSLQKEIEIRKKQSRSFLDDELLLMFHQSFTAFNDLIITRQIFHRDIKPENMLLCKDVDIKITDFGVSKTLFRQKIRASLTNTLVGTPVYLSPKLWDAFILRKDQTLKVDKVKHDLEKSDVFSLGVTFLQCSLLLTSEIVGLNQKDGPEKIKQLQGRITNHKVRTILTRMLELEESDRASYREILETFFQSNIPMRLIDNKIFSSSTSLESKSKGSSLRTTESTRIQSSVQSGKSRNQSSYDFQKELLDKNSSKQSEELDMTMMEVDFVRQQTTQQQGPKKRIFDQSPVLRGNLQQSLMRITDPQIVQTNKSLTSLTLMDRRRDTKITCLQLYQSSSLVYAQEDGNVVLEDMKSKQSKVIHHGVNKVTCIQTQGSIIVLGYNDGEMVCYQNGAIISTTRVQSPFTAISVGELGITSGHCNGKIFCHKTDKELASSDGPVTRFFYLCLINNSIIEVKRMMLFINGASRKIQSIIEGKVSFMDSGQSSLQPLCKVGSNGFISYCCNDHEIKYWKITNTNEMYLVSVHSLLFSPTCVSQFNNQIVYTNGSQIIISNLEQEKKMNTQSEPLPNHHGGTKLLCLMANDDYVILKHNQGILIYQKQE